MESIDKAIDGMVSKSSGYNESERSYNGTLAVGRPLCYSFQSWREFWPGSVSRTRQTCSVGGKPTGVKARSPLAWVASVEETKRMKPTDKAIFKDGEQVAGP
jgi:hypothetical protein